MNNEVKRWDGTVIGFQCFTCGEVKDRMWGTKCNMCRNREDENAKLRNELRKLREEIAALKENQE